MVVIIVLERRFEMLKNNSRITIKKHFLVSLIFIALMFTAFAVNCENVCAADVNESVDEVGIELDVEDTLENSQNGEMMLNSIDKQSNEVLGANTHILNGGTFRNIQTVVNNAQPGDTIILNDYFYAQDAEDGVEINKNVTITTIDGATLDGKKISKIFALYPKSDGCTIKNLKFVDGVLFRGGAIYIKANGTTIDNCEFSGNHATTAGGAIGAFYNETFSHNVVVKNCRFINNDAEEAAGALGIYGNNSKVINCTFISNSAHNNRKISCYGGAIQLGMDKPNWVGYVLNSTFENNSAYSKDGKHTHGGAGCIRDGIVYEGCTFVNNSADEGGALTYHSSGIIRNCDFINNTAFEYGGALSTGLLANSNMNLHIYDSNFNDNEAPLGGAIQLVGKNIEILNSNLNDNHASLNGGGINIAANTVTIDECSLKGNIAEVDGGAVYITGKNTYIKNSEFKNNSAIPDYDKLDEGLGGAIYVNSTNANILNNKFFYNTARNGSAIYYDKSGQNLILKNNELFQNQAWVYALPIFAEDIYYGDAEELKSIIHGGNNIAKYNNLAVSNAIYNAADYTKIKVDNQSPVNGATNSGVLYQDDREYNMEILLTVKHENGQTVYNNVLNSNYLGEVNAQLTNLEPGKYYVTAKHAEDTYYKAISNTTSFVVKPKIDSMILKSTISETYNYKDVVVWTLNITNNGPNNATGVVVRDILPEGLIYITDDSGRYNNLTGIIELGDLKVGQSILINIVTEVNRTGNITNFANVTSNEHDTDETNNVDNESIFVKSATDLVIEKSVSNSTPNYADSIYWRIVVKNNGPDAATGVEVTDLLPSSLIYESNDRNYNPHTGVWNIGNLNAGSQITLNIKCKVNATGVIRNTASVKGNEYDYDMSNNEDSSSIRVKSASDLAIVKSVNVSSVDYGKLVRWTLTVSNNGPSVATGVEVTDVLPRGLSYVDSTLTKGSYSNGVFTIGELAVGERMTINILCRADATGNFTNVASVKGIEYDYNLDNNNASKLLVVNPACDLAIVKFVNVSSVDYGKLVRWTLVVSNNGPNAATGVEVTDVLPRGLSYVNSTLTKGNYSNGVYNIGGLAVGERVTINIVARADATGNFTNVASVKGKEFDQNLANNNATKALTVNNACDLAIVKFVNVSSVDYGKLVRWTLVVSNNGPDVATGVEVADVLPRGLTYIGSTLTKGNYSNGVYNIGGLAVGERVTINIVARADATGNFTNVASVKGNEYDYNLDNNNASKLLVVNPASDLEVIKTVNESNPKFNKSITWTIKVRNNGPDMAHNVTVRDLLPSSLIYENNDRNYNPQTGEWYIGNLNAGSQITLNIRCKINATGIIQNNASVSGREYDYNMSNNKDDAMIDVENASDVSVVKLVNNTNPNYGDLVKWTVIAKNNGPDKATGVYVDEILPDGLVIQDYNLTKGIFDLGIWAVCCLEKGEIQTLEIICKVNKTGNITNVVEIHTEEYDPNTGNNIANESINVARSADIEVTKEVNINYPYYDDVVIWTIKVKNNGPDAAHNVVVFDELPEGLTFEDYDATDGIYSNNKWTIDYLDKGKTEYLYITCTLNKLDEIINNVNASAQEYDWNKSNNWDDSSIYVFPIVDVSVVKTVNNTSPDYGDVIKWILIVENNGPNDASNVTVYDELPAGLTLIGCEGGNYINGEFYIGDLASGDRREFEIICKVSATGEFTNYASVTSNEYDSDLSNNDNHESIYVRPAADLSITKTVSRYYYTAGELVRYAVAVVNNGPDSAENVKVNEMLGGSLLLKSFKASYGDFDKVTKEWTMDTLENGESATLYLDALATDEGVAENDVSVSSDTYDYDLSNNEDFASVEVSKRPDSPANISHVPVESHLEKNIAANNNWDKLPYKMIASGNPFVVLLLSLIFSVVILTKGISNRR